MIEGAPLARATELASLEARLIDRIRHRDVRAFERLYRAYHPRLARYLTTLTHRPPLVEEVLNDTMMVVWNRIETFNGSSKLSTWIFAIAYRQALSALRHWDQPVEDPDPDRLQADGDDPEHSLGQQSRHDSLQRAMGDLSPAHRSVLDLTYFHELSTREIAEIMNCPIDTVKTRMFHARRHLRRILPGELIDWL